MTSEDKPRRKIRPGAIEADPKEMAILVHYEAEEIVDGMVTRPNPLGIPQHLQSTLWTPSQ